MPHIHLQPKQGDLLDLIEHSPASVIGVGGGRGAAKSGGADRIALVLMGEQPGCIACIVMRNYDQVRKYHIEPIVRDFPEVEQFLARTDHKLKLPVQKITSELDFSYAESLEDVKRRFRSGNYRYIFVDQAEQFTWEELSEMMLANRTRGSHQAKTVLLFNMGGIGIQDLRNRFGPVKKFNENEHAEDYSFLHVYPWDNVEWSRSELERDGLTEDDYYSWTDESRFKYFVARSPYGRKLNALDDATVDRSSEVDESKDPEVESAGELDDELAKSVIVKVKTFNQSGKANRMAEVCNARDQRLYFRDIQNFYWSEDRQDVVFDTEDDDSPYDRVFNIFQGYGKIFISTFLGAKPKVRAEADDPFDEASIRNTSKANTFERVYRKKNDIATQQTQISRLMFTDGRIVSRIDMGDDGVPFTELFGVLETRLSINADDIEDCLLIEIDKDLPTSKLKAQYPDAKKKINSGNGDSYERNARIAVRRQAGSDTAIDVQTGQDSYGLSTKTWSYLRPEFYQEFEDADCQQLEQHFPAGLCVVRNGDVYLESYEYDCDKHLDVLHAMPGDGMSRPSIGTTLMTIQDSANTSMNLIEETFDHGIPTTYYNKETNIDGLNKQRERPGASRKMMVPKGTTAEQNFFETEAVNPSAQLMEYAENLRGPIAQFAAGTQPAAFGAEMPDQKTASGYSQARNMALGQMAIVWKPYTSWYTRETTRAVKLASGGQNEISANLSPDQPGAKPESVKILPGELSGMSFTNDSDENFPETWTEKSNKFMSLIQMGGPIADDMMQKSPSNWYMAKQMIGLQGLTIPQEALWEMVLSDIAEMEHDPATPDPRRMPQQALPGVGQPPVQTPSVSPIQIDTDYLTGDDFETCFNAVKDWIQSSKGREVKLSNDTWYKNVRLYGLQYRQQMDAQKQANQPVPPPDLPKVQIPYDSLPVSGKIQAAQKAGIQLTPQDIATAPVKPPVAAGIGA